MANEDKPGREKGPLGHLRDGRDKAVLAALSDATLDTEKKMAKIRQILVAHEKLAGHFGRGGDDAEDETFVAKKSPSAEAIAMQLRLASGQRRLAERRRTLPRQLDLAGFARYLHRPR